MKQIVIKKKGEKALLGRHPWIFSGAIAAADEGIAEGELVLVRDGAGNTLGTGYFNGRSQIRVRMLAFGDTPVTDSYLSERIAQALARRDADPFLAGTDACRLINGEDDFLPGLVVDTYRNHLVVQIATAGMERLKPLVVAALRALRSPESVYERSDHPGRSIEGLPPRAGQLWGETPPRVAIEEDGLRFLVDIPRGQKTGFFLDQRENRRMVRALARGRRVLNCYAYTGGFTAAALAGGAREVVSVDASAEALALLEENLAANGLAGANRSVTADVPAFLRGFDGSADFIILDPPAFAKGREQVDRACRGYKDINLVAARSCPPGSLLLTCSCSRFIDMDLFQKVVFAAMSDARREAVIMRKTHHATDHPVSIFHPEGEYLKALLLSIV